MVVTNTGNQPLSPTVNDDKCSIGSPTESGNSNGILDVGETWAYTYSYTPTQVPDPNPLVNKVTVTVPGLTPQTAQASVTVSEAPCVKASISDFTVTSQCSCPEGYEAATKSWCSDCQRCEECTITISNVNATGTSLRYRYGYARKKSGRGGGGGGGGEWESFAWSQWTADSNYTITGINECSYSKEYKVRVEVKSQCGDSTVASYEKTIALAGGECKECCNFSLKLREGYPVFKWTGGPGGSWKVDFKGDIQNNVCNHRLQATVEIWKIGGTDQGLKGDYTMEANGNFGVVSKIDTSWTGNIDTNNWKAKVIIKDIEQGSSCSDWILDNIPIEKINFLHRFSIYFDKPWYNLSKPMNIVLVLVPSTKRGGEQNENKNHPIPQGYTLFN